MSRVRIGIFLGLSAALALPACAQYPGRIATTAPSGTTHLRATAVLEYTGELSDLKANRLVPIVVWDGTQYQPGGLYLAQPAPLAVLNGTQYELESDGRSQGFFNVKSAENLGGHWFGVGKFQPPAAPKALVAKSHSGHAYQIKENQEDPDKPHFAHRPAPEPGTDTQADAAHPATGKPDQSDHTGPTLHPRTHSGSDTTSGEPEADPDRPTFHRRTTQTATTSTMEVDPNRPHLGYTAPESQEKLETADALSGMPPDMRQIAAVSDNTTTDTQSFVFSWANPDDAHKMEDALEKAAVEAIGPIKPAQNEPAPTPGPSSTQESSSPEQARPSLNAGRPSLQAGKPSAHTAPQKTPKTARKRTTAKKPAALAPAVLEDVQFRVFSLSFGGGATMVLSAYAAGDPGKYVTVIAQPDFYGNPQILLKQVASADNLDVTPRLKLIDAVDTQGNHRGDLIFELRGQTYRQFAIYRIAGGQASQVFLTQPTPTS